MRALPPGIRPHVSSGTARLYRDDLERIVGLMTAAGLRVSIRDREFEYDSLEQLERRVGATADELTIEGRNTEEYGRLEVSYSRGDQWSLSASGPSESDGLGQQVAEILRRRETPISRLPLYWIGFAGFLIYAVGGTVNQLTSTLGIGNYLSSVGATLLFGSIAGGLFLHFYPRALLRYRHDSGFVRRNRDQLRLLTIGTALGVFLKWLFDRL